MTDDVVYLDYAATCGVRPPEVIEAVTRFLATVGATPGRSAHRLSIEASRIALRCRQALARLLGVPGDPGRIAFMANATQALNTALWGVLRSGDVLVVTAFDHNAVLRPAFALARERGVSVRLVAGKADGTLDAEAVNAALKGARLVALNGASNVLGTALPLRDLTARAHEAGALVLLDLAQVAGHMPVDVAAIGADLVAFTGHKGLLGPQGTGGLWVRAGLDVTPLLRGGTGGDSLLADMPDAYPDHLEAGTLNGPGIAGLLAGVEWIERQGGAGAIHERVTRHKLELHGGLSRLDGVRVLSPPSAAGAPIVTLVADALDPAAMARRLDAEFGVLVRAGLHCAPEAHRLLGTERTGAVRFSAGWATTESEIARALDAVTRVLGATARPATKRRAPRGEREEARR